MIGALIKHKNDCYQAFWTGLGKRSISDGEEVSREKGRAVLDTESPDMLRASPVQQIPARPLTPVSVDRCVQALAENLYTAVRSIRTEYSNRDNKQFKRNHTYQY